MLLTLVLIIVAVALVLALVAYLLVRFSSSLGDDEITEVGSWTDVTHHRAR